MAKDESKKKIKSEKDLASIKDFTEAVKIMANTPPISNADIVKRNKKRKG